MNTAQNESHSDSTQQDATFGGTFNNNGIVQDVASAIYKYNTWVMLAGYTSLIISILLSLTIVALVVTWVGIWLGILLIRSAKSIKTAYTTGSIYDLEHAFSQLNLYFKISGIVSLILLILGLFASIIGGAFYLSTH